jgi:glycosyltransferase involved in cell wall biosynthesis
MPKVSVIIPNYNYGRFLARRLESVLGQSFKDLEVIYLDDASSDDSAAVFAGYASDPRIRAMSNEVNSANPFKQWNKGAALAQGEYLWIAEADDYADPRFLSRLVKALDQDPGAGLAFCASRVVNEQDEFLPEKEGMWTEGLAGQDWKRDFGCNGPEFCGRYLIVRNVIPNASAVLVRRSALSKAGGADETKIYAGDWMTWARVLFFSDLEYVAEPLNFYRVHQQTVRRRIRGTGLGILESYQVMRAILDNVPVAPEVLERASAERMKQWMAEARAQDAKISWALQGKIFRAAGEVDPALKMRLLKKAWSRMVGPRPSP